LTDQDKVKFEAELSGELRLTTIKLDSEAGNQKADFTFQSATVLLETKNGDRSWPIGHVRASCSFADGSQSAALETPCGDERKARLSCKVSGQVARDSSPDEMREVLANGNVGVTVGVRVDVKECDGPKKFYAKVRHELTDGGRSGQTDVWETGFVDITERLLPAGNPCALPHVQTTCLLYHLSDASLDDLTKLDYDWAVGVTPATKGKTVLDHILRCCPPSEEFRKKLKELSDTLQGDVPQFPRIPRPVRRPLPAGGRPAPPRR
jgi:hypothetical protein